MIMLLKLIIECLSNYKVKLSKKGGLSLDALYLLHNFNYKHDVFF